MFQTTDSYQYLLNDKRFRFQVEIRRQHREHQFSERRAILAQNKDLELLSQFALECFNRTDIEETKNYLIKINQYADSQFGANLKSLLTFQNLYQIALCCDFTLIGLIITIFQKINLIECLSINLLQAILRFENYGLVKEFVVLLNKVVQNHPLNQLIEDYDFVSYLVDVSLHLEQFEEWFEIIEYLCKYETRPSHYFKKLIIPAFKLLDYDSSDATIQLVECMCSCKADHKNAINYLLILPGFISFLIEYLSKQNSHAIHSISIIIESSDDGAIKLIQDGLLQILSNLFYEMKESWSLFIYQIANLCYIKNQYVIHEVLTSEIFHNILALDNSELSIEDCRIISRMLRQLIKRYTNEQIYFYLLHKTDLVFILGHLLQRIEDPEIIMVTLQTILHMAYSPSEDFVKQFRQVMKRLSLENIHETT